MSHSSGEMVRVVIPPNRFPVPLTRMSMRPKRRITSSTIRRTGSGSVTSQTMATDPVPREVNSAAFFSAASRSLSTTATDTPLSAKPSAIAPPIPTAPPVTIATLPARSEYFAIGLLLRDDPPIGWRAVDDMLLC